MQKLYKDSVFQVKESMGVNIFIGLAFIAMCVSTFLNKEEGETGFQFHWLQLTIIPAILFIYKGMKRKTAITINRKGIWYYAEFITDWERLVEAKIDQDEVLMSIQDNFVLFIHYRMMDGRINKVKIPLRNTLNKAEEEIIAAIRFFSVKENRS